MAVAIGVLSAATLACAFAPSLGALAPIPTVQLEWLWSDAMAWDTERTKRLLLDAGVEEFSAQGLAGARSAR
jgi:hypothetical protein